MYIYLNGTLVPEHEAVVSVYDHGFLYGDGIYETMRSYGGVVFMLDEHLGRLERSASLIGLTLPLDGDALGAAIHETLRANQMVDAYVRITVSRGEGPLGLDPALCAQPTVVILTGRIKPYPPEFYDGGVPVIVAGTRRNLKEALDPRIKSLNFLNNILAKREALESGAFEALMLNHEGFVAEGTVSNVFLVARDVVCTPSLECGILDGITRGHVMALAREAGFDVVEGKFTRGMLLGAEEVFLTNTSMEVMPVGQVDGTACQVGPVAQKLREAYGRTTARA
jgi:branched-chain amino acid aminotransferase